MTKPQVIVISGGHSFNRCQDYLAYLQTRQVSLADFLAKTDWKTNLSKKLGQKYQILAPRMPNKENARYLEWKIWFERLRPFVRSGIVLVGHSLGGIFLVKYLAENTFPKKIKQLILVAAPYQEKDLTNFKLPSFLAQVARQCQEIHLFHSPDDPVVAIAAVYKYQQAWPKAKLHILKNRGHFNQSTFPEIVKIIKPC